MRPVVRWVLPPPIKSPNIELKKSEKSPPPAKPCENPPWPKLLKLNPSKPGGGVKLAPCCQFAPKLSYLLFFSLSDKTSYASLISLNLLTASGDLLTSGWYCLASFLYADLIFASVASVAPYFIARFVRK